MLNWCEPNYKLYMTYYWPKLTARHLPTFSDNCSLKHVNHFWMSWNPRSPILPCTMEFLKLKDLHSFHRSRSIKSRFIILLKEDLNLNLGSKFHNWSSIIHLSILGHFDPPKIFLTPLWTQAQIKIPGISLGYQI